MIIYNKNAENIGAVRNIYKCISLSTSKYVWVLGDDDFIERGFIKKIVKIIQENSQIPFFYIPMRVWYPDREFHFGDNINSEINIAKKNYNNLEIEYVKYDSLKKIANFDRGYFNAISNFILLSEDYLKAFKIGVEGGKEFTSIETTFPHSYYLALNYLEKPCIDIIDSGLICSYAVSWRKYYEITWLKWFPELIDLMVSNGADKDNALNGKRIIIRSKYRTMIPQIIKRNFTHFEYFSYRKFLKDNIFIKDFWRTLLRIIVKDFILKKKY